MPFSAEQRRRVVEHRLKELNIPTVAELARRASVDEGNLSKLLSDGIGLSPQLRARVADVLRLPPDQFDLLLDPEFDPHAVTYRLDIWQHVRGGGDEHERHAAALKRATEERHAKEPPKVSLWRTRGKGPRNPPPPPVID